MIGNDRDNELRDDDSFNVVQPRITVSQWVKLSLLWVAICIIVFSVLPSEAAVHCSRAYLTWENPTTRKNGKPLTIDELDYFVVRVTDEGGNKEEYILSRFNVTDQYGVVQERVYSTEESFNMKLREGLQCFEIKVVDTDGLESDYSTPPACKEMCLFDVKLKIEAGVVE